VSALARRRWRNRTVEKVCPFCEQPFKGDKRQTYCTPAHQNAAAVRRHRERRSVARTGEEE
jgi:hypothetical protein